MARYKRLTGEETERRMTELRARPGAIGECEAGVFVVEGADIMLRRADTGWMPDQRFGADTPATRFLITRIGWLYERGASCAA